MTFLSSFSVAFLPFTLVYSWVQVDITTAFHSPPQSHSFHERISKQVHRIQTIHDFTLKYKIDDIDEIINAHEPQNLSPKIVPNKIPQRPLTAPFPNGLNKGRLVTLPPSLHFASSDQDLLPPRDVYVWLPSHYDDPVHATTKFPVLYCHDGQNAIEDSSSWTGSSWRLAGALTRLAERNLLDTPKGVPPIVVMIPCCEGRMGMVIPRRHLEYGDVVSPFAQAHADLVGTVIQPLIDEKFRTLGTKAGNSVIGSSLGGQASLHLALRHSDQFGNCACLSPAFQPGILSMVATVPEATLQKLSLYLDNGGDDEEQNIKVPFLDVQDHMTMQHWWNPGYWFLDSSLQMGLDAMRLALDMRGAKYVYNKIAGGRHNERAWANRIDKPLLALYGKKGTDS